MLINNIRELRCAARNPYAWPGGYPTYFLCDDGAALCHACLSKERRNIIHSVHHKQNDGWRVVALDINYEDSDLTCAHCDKQIESAYGDDNN
jgi:hypothetical protein